MPLVYIILLNWNGWRDTIACLDSLGNLTYPDFKVIVVDNGSTDESVACIRNAHPAVTLLEAGGNLGFSGGNNIGIRYALESGAEFVWVLNNDTVVTNNALSAMVDMAISNAKIGAVGSVLYFMDAPTVVQAWGGGCVSLWSGISRHRSIPGQLNYITGASILLSKAALNQIGLLDDGFFMYWEDTDLSFRLSKSGWKLAVAERAQVFHKEAASHGLRSVNFIKYYTISSIRFYTKHGYLPVIPIAIGFTGRLVKSILRGRFDIASAACISLIHGLRLRKKPL